jgi:hypothetical protein
VSFADPQSVTISAVTTPLPRVSTGRLSSDYLSADGLIALKASSSYGNRIRQVLRLDHKKVSADLYLPDRNVERSMSCYVVFDRPAYGYTNADALAVYTGFKTQFTASSDLLITKLLGGES